MLTEAWQRGGQPTVFVQVPSLRTALERVLAPFHAPADVPLVRPWPTYPARWWSRIGRPRVEASIRRRAAALRRQLDRVIAWEHAVAVVVSPVWNPWLDELPFRHVVYDCIDDLAVHVPRPKLAALYHSWEDKLLARASGAVVTAERLGDGLRARRPELRVALIRNGVDAERFLRMAAGPRPADLPATGRPIVGFVGALYEWIDWNLIRATAERMPEAEFVLIGPEDGRGRPDLLSALPNVHLLGPRPYDRVPAYVQAFDVGWVPFVQSDVGRAANPVKIYEYLALGKPVVTTPVADTEAFGGLVGVACTPDEMVEHLRAALHTPGTQAEQRLAFARENTWDARARDYMRFLESIDREARPG